jgi:hypothetical protein
VVSAWANEDAPAAIAWSEQHLSTAQQAQVWPAVAKAFAQRDPEAAKQWVSSLVEEDVRTQAVSALVSGWDDPAALDWARSLPSAVERDAALLAYAKVRAIHLDFPSAMEIAVSTPPSGAERADQIQNTWREWYGKDAAAADAWLQNTADVSAEEKETLRSSLEAFGPIPR